MRKPGNSTTTASGLFGEVTGPDDQSIDSLGSAAKKEYANRPALCSAHVSAKSRRCKSAGPHCSSCTSTVIVQGRLWDEKGVTVGRTEIGFPSSTVTRLRR